VGLPDGTDAELAWGRGAFVRGWGLPRDSLQWGMEPAIQQTAKRRIQLRVSDDLYDRLTAQAARGNASIQELITQWLEEKLKETEAGKIDGPVDPEWRRRFESLVAEFRSEIPADVSPAEIEADITAARQEVREARRAGRR
jgi:hypothetical protein